MPHSTFLPYPILQVFQLSSWVLTKHSTTTSLILIQILLTFVPDKSEPWYTSKKHFLHSARNLEVKENWEVIFYGLLTWFTLGIGLQKTGIENPSFFFHFIFVMILFTWNARLVAKLKNSYLSVPGVIIHEGCIDLK